MRRRRTRGRDAVWGTVLAVGLAVPGSIARADFDKVADLYAAGSWDQARLSASDRHSDPRKAEAALWQSRLAPDPSTALRILHDAASDKRLAQPVRVRLALESAELELGRGHPSEAIAALAPVLRDRDDLPGQVPVLAARALLAIGRGPRARELLAGVRSTDPAFAQSRAILGDIALAQGDGTQALRWYDAADQADPSLRSRTVSGRCRALLLKDRPDEVDALESRLVEADPGSLALLEIRRARRDHEEETNSRQPALPAFEAPATAAAPAAADPVPAQAAPATSTRRYTLQLGAFGDRARALDFLERYRTDVDGLAIEEGVDAQGRHGATEPAPAPGTARTWPQCAPSSSKSGWAWTSSWWIGRLPTARAIERMAPGRTAPRAPAGA